MNHKFAYKIVLRSWLEAANDEKESRGPCHCIIDRDKMDDLINYIKNIRINPSIGFFFLPEDMSCDIEGIFSFFKLYLF